MARIDIELNHAGCKAGREPEHRDPDAHPISAWDRVRIEQFIADDLAARKARATDR